MTDAIEVIPVPRPFDARTLLAHVNRRIIALRTALGHDHGDAAFWSALDTTAADAQYERRTLRQVANLLHVERATRRGRIHGTRFAMLDDQRAWLARMELVTCVRAARYLGLPDRASLAKLRAGEVHAQDSGEVR